MSSIYGSNQKLNGRQYSNSSLARKAQQLMTEQDLLSSSSSESEEHHQPYIPSRFQYADHHQTTIKRKKRKNPSKDFKEKLGSLSSRCTSSHKEKKRSRSLSKKASQKTLKHNASIEIPHNMNCTEQKEFLRNRISELEQTISRQNAKIKQVYQKVHEEKDEVKKLSDKLYDAKKSKHVIKDLEQKLFSMQSNELNLIRELTEQQKHSKVSMHKLSRIQEDSLKEIENAKQSFKEHYERRVREERDEFEMRLQTLKLEKDQLNNTIRNIEDTANLEKTNQSIAMNNEVVQLTTQLNQKQLENERLRSLVRELENKIQDNKYAYEKDVKALKIKNDTLTEQMRSMKLDDDEIHNRDKNDLRKKVINLERELEQAEIQMRKKDDDHRENIEKINDKVYGLQYELKKLNECEARVEILTRELSLKDNELEMQKKFYKDKLDAKRKTVLEQKKEWSTIYNELLGEIRQLKEEIDSLGVENRKLATSMGASRSNHNSNNNNRYY